MKKRWMQCWVWALCILLMGLCRAQAETGWPGENLLRGSMAEGTADENGRVTLTVGDALAPYVGRTVTVSFDISADREGTVLVYAGPAGGVSIGNSQAQGQAMEVRGGGFSRGSFTTQVRDYWPVGMPADGEIVFSADQSSGMKFSIRRVKIELGDQATAWMPGEDDRILGANLLVDSVRPRHADHGRLQIPLSEEWADYAGLPVTISFDAQGTAGQTVLLDGETGGAFTLLDETPGEITLQGDDYARYTVHAVMGRGQGSTEFRGGEFSVRRIKIELGLRGTAYTLHDEDPMLGEELFVLEDEVASTAYGKAEIPLGEALRGYEGLPVCVRFLIAGEVDGTVQMYASQNGGASIGVHIGGKVAVPVQSDRTGAYFVETDVWDYGQPANAGSIIFQDERANPQPFRVLQMIITLGKAPAELIRSSN